MKINGNANIEGTVSGAFEHYDTLPENPKVGTWAFIHKTLMMCIELEDKPFWIPLSPERNTVVREQTTASTVWIVDHNFDRNNVMMQCFDSMNKVVVPDSIEPIDSNSTRISFPEAISGATIAMFGYENGTAISSGEVNNNGGGGSPVSTITAFASKEAMLKFGTGYIGLDGQKIEYKSFPQLYVALGGVEGSEDTITLPDANGAGAFMRGGRTNGVGFDLIQAQSILKHSHKITAFDVSNPSAVFVINDDSGDVLASTDNSAADGGSLRHARYTTENTGDSENRPVNFSGYWAIKAFGAIAEEGELDISSILSRIQKLESDLSSVTKDNETMSLELAKNKSKQLSVGSAGAYISGGDMFGDTALTYEDLRINMLRSGNAVSLSGQLNVSGFRSELDNDASCNIRLNIAKLGDASKLFTSALGNAYGTANFQFYDDEGGADCIGQAGYVSADSKVIELRLLESISAKGTQFTDRVLIRFSVTFSVNQ